MNVPPAARKDSPTLLVLAPDVLIIPFGDVAEDLRTALALGPDEYVLSRPGTRGHSLVIDADAARLLSYFRDPQTELQAVTAHCAATMGDAAATLVEARGLLERLQAIGVLIPIQDSSRRTDADALGPGTQCGNYAIVKRVKGFDDHALYKARDEHDAVAALKITAPRPSQAAIDRLHHEAGVLQNIGGQHAPVFYGSGRCGPDDERHFVAMEWRDGDPVGQVADGLRDRAAGESKAERSLLALCSAVLDAYASIHARGVIHGDVHPGNVIARQERGQWQVTLLDFELARLSLPGAADPGRGGIIFYYEPEHAQAILAGLPVPPATFAGEQYAAAALVYRLLTGQPYLRFGLEQQQVLEQILRETPLPFATEPALERALTRALDKDPARRFESMAELARAFEAAAAENRQADAGHRQTPPRPVRSQNRPVYPNDVLEKLAGMAAAGLTSDPSAPQMSVAHGAAGVAYLFYRAACLKGLASWLAAADQWASWAETNSSDITAFHDQEVGQEAAAPTSLYYGLVGVHAVRVLISQAQGHFSAIRRDLAHFVEVSRQPATGPDLTSGTAGALLGCALLYEALSRIAWVATEPLVQLGDALLSGLWAQLDSLPQVRQCREIPYLGIAHGWAGILYSTLRWARLRRNVAPPGLPARLEELAACALYAGDAVYWPPSNGSPDPPWPGWCHGTAGHVHLWALAYQVYRQDRFLALAVGAGLHTWRHPNRITAHLCCGLAGQAEALLELRKITGDPVWLARAQELAELAFNVPATQLRLNSLLKGDVGLALLALDLAQPSAACMPLFAGEGWPVR